MLLIWWWWSRLTPFEAKYLGRFARAFLNDDGVFPWFENNQGTLSLAALVFAILAFLHENKRAHRAEAEAKASEIRRRAEAEDAARRQDRALRQAELKRQLNHAAQFLRAARGLVAPVRAAISAERKYIADTTNRVFSPSAETRNAAATAARSLNALLPAVPMMPTLVTDVCALVGEMEHLVRSDSASGDAGKKILNGADAAATRALEKFTQHDIEVRSELGKMIEIIEAGAD